MQGSTTLPTILDVLFNLTSHFGPVESTTRDLWFFLRPEDPCYCEFHRQDELGNLISSGYFTVSLKQTFHYKPILLTFHKPQLRIHFHIGRPCPFLQRFPQLLSSRQHHSFGLLPTRPWISAPRSHISVERGKHTH